MRKCIDWIAGRLGYVRAVDAPFPKVMAREEMLAAFAEDNRILQAVDCIVCEAIAGANTTGQTPQLAQNHGMLAYYAGGAAYLQELRDKLAEWRAAAKRAAQA